MDFKKPFSGFWIGHYMKIELFADGMNRKDIVKDPWRKASRAIIMREGLLLVLYVPKLDVFLFPGGGRELGESALDCVLREVLEETGYPIENVKEGATVVEYFHDSTWENTYFLANLASDQPQAVNWTEEEKAYGMEIKWMDPQDFLSILDEYDSKNPYGQAIHQREFLGMVNSFGQ